MKFNYQSKEKRYAAKFQIIVRIVDQGKHVASIEKIRSQPFDNPYDAVAAAVTTWAIIERKKGRI